VFDTLEELVSTQDQVALSLDGAPTRTENILEAALPLSQQRIQICTLRVALQGVSKTRLGQVSNIISIFEGASQIQQLVIARAFSGRRTEQETQVNKPKPGRRPVSHGATVDVERRQ